MSLILACGKSHGAGTGDAGPSGSNTMDAGQTNSSTGDAGQFGQPPSDAGRGGVAGAGNRGGQAGQGQPLGPSDASDASNAGPARDGGLEQPHTLSCAAATPGAAPPSGVAVLEADTPGGDNTRIFAYGSRISVSFTTRTTGADHVTWHIRDLGKATAAEGDFDVAPGVRTTTVACTSTLAGYFAISASLADGTGLPAKGSRPAGIATFGVLSDIATVLPPLALAHTDAQRFGIQGTTSITGGDGFQPLYGALGVTWVNDSRAWEHMEPQRAATYSEASIDPPPARYAQDGLVRYLVMNGIPGWANASGQATNNYPPTSFQDYGDFVGRVAAQQKTIRINQFPQQAHNYYQITWEPDPGPGTQWKGSIPDFLNLYKTAFRAIHAADPSAVVLGPSDSGLGNVLATNVANEPISLNNPALADLPQYLDGLSVHGYYTAGCVPENPPETSTIFSAMKALRHVMATKFPPHAKLISSEMGINYAGKYTPTYPDDDYLFRHGVIIPRAHLILLGEGVDVSYVFYAADYSGEPGFGVNFNLAMPNPDFGTPQISPKPAAMAVATMTRLVDGSVSLGPLKSLPAGAYGYSFQRGSDTTITALWAHNDGYSARVAATIDVDAPGTAGAVVVVDAMGNPTSVAFDNGKLSLVLEESPQYVVARNVAVAAAHASAPEGYSPEP